MSLTRTAMLLYALVPLDACGSDAPGIPPATWRLMLIEQRSGTEALLQSVSPVSDDVVWVSGHQATYARSVDGGVTWTAAVVPEADGLQFRDVAAFDERTAYLMSAGSGDRSRIYRTDDGGGTWTLQYTADHPEAFLDCMDFWSPERGLSSAIWLFWISLASSTFMPLTHSVTRLELAMALPQP